MAKKDKETKKDSKEDLTSLIFLDAPKEASKIRMIGLFGNLDEELTAEIAQSFIALKDYGKEEIYEDPEDPNSPIKKTIYKPIDFYISTYGGQASEMFGVYDLMRLIKQQIPIRTYGIGKVMSAGVLLLAAGTKGERRLGRNCRVMIHGVISGQHGHIADVENEFSEAKMTQKLYVKALVEETNMTDKEIRKMMNKKTNVYIDAEKAVELGIADIIF